MNDVAEYREEQRVFGVQGDVLKIKPQIVFHYQVNAMHHFLSEGLLVAACVGICSSCDPFYNTLPT